MNIYIFYEHLTREWDSVVRLKSVLENKNNKVYVFSTLFEKNKSYFCSIFAKPDVIIMPWFDCSQHEKIIWFFTKVNPIVRIINLHHEQLGEPSSIEYYMPKTLYGRNAAFHISWGDEFKNNLINHGVSKKRIFVTGNIRTDLLKKTNVGKEYLAKKYNLDLSKPWILFAESRGYYSQRTRKSELKALLSVGITKKEIIDQIKFERKSMFYFFKDIKSVPPNWYSKYEFIYRPHPGTLSPTKLPSWIKVIPDRSISDWIQNVELFISCGSTSIFEAEIAGTPCALYDNYTRPKERTIVGLDRYPLIRSIKEIDKSLILYLKNQSSSIYEDYFGKADGMVADRITNVIYNSMDGSYDYILKKYSKKISRPSVFEILKLLIYEVVSYIVIKLSLIDIIKWPSSVYTNIKDIPYCKKNKWIYEKK